MGVWFKFFYNGQKKVGISGQLERFLAFYSFFFFETNINVALVERN